MIDTGTLDKQIASLAPWIDKAGDALLTFFNRAQSVFWRDSLAFDDNNRKPHPTSTHRSFFALYEYVRFLGECDAATHQPEEVLRILKQVAECYLCNFRSVATEGKVRQSASNGLNMFTDSHLLRAVSILPHLRRALETNGIQLHLDLARILGRGSSLARLRLKDLSRWTGGRVKDDDRLHDFITLYCVRALDSLHGQGPTLSVAISRKLTERVRQDVLTQLGLHKGEVFSRFDALELTFTATLLSRFPTADSPNLLRQAVSCIVEAQNRDGSWPPTRTISRRSGTLLYVASYEVALALTQCLLQQLRDGQTTLVELAMPSLERTFQLVRSQYTELGPMRGWCDDHHRGSDQVASWATAIVLTFLVYYRDALLALRQMLVLEKYAVEWPSRPDKSPWADMHETGRQEDQIRVAELRSCSDPTTARRLTSAIERDIVRPIAQDPHHRPKAVSLILWGKPGTRKTSLARGIAHSLGWPLMIVTPSDFLRRGGLEQFESSAAAIFDDLCRIRRVVILFDECEDLFKKRGPDQRVESRTLGAFITAGMLPRLQKLRDERWTVFILATNATMDELDSAVTRRGRFDYAQEIPHPTINAQLRYVARKVREQKLKRPRQLIQRIARTLRAASNADAGLLAKQPDVTFLILDELIKAVRTKGLTSGADIDEEFNAIRAQQTAPRIV